MITTIPVALVRNNSTTQTATSVMVTFSVLSGGTVVRRDTTQAEDIPPGATVGFVMRQDLGGQGDTATAVVHAGTWTTGPVPQWTASAVSASCPGCAGAGLGIARFTLTAQPGATTGALDARIVCTAGGILVGGADETIVATSLAPQHENIETITSAPPTHCSAWASPTF